MSDTDCNCTTAAVEQVDDQRTTTPGWIDARPVRAAAFPTPVATNMTRFFGTRVQTFDDLVDAIRGVVENDAIAVEELCHVDDASPHVATTGTETYHFRCFYDGIALALLLEAAVDVRTETPANETVEVSISPEAGLEVTPPDAVMSFGLATDATAQGDEPSSRDMYGAICPYVKAFTGREEYEEWAECVAATTIGLSLDDGLPIAEALTAGAEAAE